MEPFQGDTSAGIEVISDGVYEINLSINVNGVNDDIVREAAVYASWRSS
jgi:hypothetical protein